MTNKKILLGFTTTRGSDWRKKIEDIKRLNITEIALFPTCLDLGQRQELYALLKETAVNNIPHVHLRSDMTVNEIEYLRDTYHVQYFNIHPTSSDYPFLYDYTKYASQIYVENSNDVPSLEDLNKYAGICLDFSHWETGDGVYNGLEELVMKYPIGCCHVSAYRFVWSRLCMCDDHTYYNLSDFDYMKKYVQYLPDVISLELENNFDEQLKAKEYLEKLIG